MGDEARNGRKLDFVARLSDWRSRVRAYIHNTCVEPEGGGIYFAYEHFWDILTRYRSQANAQCGDSENFSIGIVWRDFEGEVPVVDFFRYSGIPEENWLANPEVHSFVFRGGVYSPLKAISCEQGLIVVGEEGRARMLTKSSEEYFRSPPPISGLEDLRVDRTI